MGGDAVLTKIKCRTKILAKLCKSGLKQSLRRTDLMGCVVPSKAPLVLLLHCFALRFARGVFIYRDDFRILAIGFSLWAFFAVRWVSLHRPTCFDLRREDQVRRGREECVPESYPLL
jgi:hypothetical protein